MSPYARYFDGLYVGWQVLDEVERFQHRLKCGDKVGDWASYRGVAMLMVGSRTFIAVTSYFDCTLPTEQPVEINLGKEK